MQFIIFHSPFEIDIPYRKLFDETTLTFIKNKVDINKFNIYFITRVPKVYFIQNSIIQLNKGSFSCKYRFGSQIKNINLSIEELCFKIPYLKAYAQILGQEKASIKYLKEKSTNKLLKFLVKSNLKEEELPISTEMLDFLFKVKPEIIYIGQSKNIISRVQSHKMVNKASSIKSDNEEIRIFFLNFQMGHGNHISTPLLSKSVSELNLNKDTTSKKYKTRYTLLERILISYFTPLLNDHHTKTPLELDSLIKEELISENINRVVLFFKNRFDSKLNFWSESKKGDNQIVNYTLNRSKSSFQEGVL